MTYLDRTLTCVDCGAEFVHSVQDQEYYAQKGFVSDPKRCPSCRAARRSMRDGTDGPDRERGALGPREYFAVVCTRCGNQALVPFKPHMDRPVYCSDCFRIVHAQGALEDSPRSPVRRAEAEAPSERPQINVRERGAQAATWPAALPHGIDRPTGERRKRRPPEGDRRLACEDQAAGLVAA